MTGPAHLHRRRGSTAIAAAIYATILTGVAVPTPASGAPPTWPVVQVTNPQVGSPQRGNAEVTDSAGIPVVTSGPQPAPGSPPWTLAAQPLLQLGIADGAQPYRFDRIAGGAVLSDGTVVIAEAESLQLRFFNALGDHLVSVGNVEGEPEVFRTIQLVGVFAGDSIVVLDRNARRFSVVAPDGTRARGYPVPEAVVLGGLPMGVLHDGSVVMKRAVPVPDGVSHFRRQSLIDVLTPDGQHAGALGEFPGHETVVLPDSYAVGVPWWRTVYSVAGGRNVAVGTNDAFSIRMYRADGSVERLVRQDVPPDSTVDTTERDRQFENIIAGAEARRFLSADVAPEDLARQQERLAPALAQVPRHETPPAFGGLLLDRADNLWVRRYSPVVTLSNDWQVFGPDGALLAPLTLPEGLIVLEIGDYWVLGYRYVDGSSFRRVEMHLLMK